MFLREPLNNFAGLAKLIGRPSFNQYLKAYFQTLRFCEYIEKLNNTVTPLFSDVILFSAWQRDEQYRPKELPPPKRGTLPFKALPVRPYLSASIRRIDFDPVKKQEKLFTRWREMRDDPFFLSLFLNDRVFQAVETYYDMFGSIEPTPKSIPHDLRRPAQTRPEAVKLCRVWLDGFEKDHPVFNSVERGRFGAYRRLLRGYLQSKLAVCRLIYAGFSASAADLKFLQR